MQTSTSPSLEPVEPFGVAPWPLESLESLGPISRPYSSHQAGGIARHLPLPQTDSVCAVIPTVSHSEAHLRSETDLSTRSCDEEAELRSGQSNSSVSSASSGDDISSHDASTDGPLQSASDPVSPRSSFYESTTRAQPRQLVTLGGDRAAGPSHRPGYRTQLAPRRRNDRAATRGERAVSRPQTLRTGQGEQCQLDDSISSSDVSDLHHTSNQRPARFSARPDAPPKPSPRKHSSPRKTNPRKQRPQASTRENERVTMREFVVSTPDSPRTMARAHKVTSVPAVTSHSAPLCSLFVLRLSCTAHRPGPSKTATGAPASARDCRRTAANSSHAGEGSKCTCHAALCGRYGRVFTWFCFLRLGRWLASNGRSVKIW